MLKIYVIVPNTIMFYLSVIASRCSGQIEVLLLVFYKYGETICSSLNVSTFILVYRKKRSASSFNSAKSVAKSPYSLHFIFMGCTHQLLLIQYLLRFFLYIAYNP